MCDIKELKIHRKCTSPTEPMVLFVIMEGKQLGLCNKCWSKVADSDLEWGDEPRIENFQQWLEKGRGLEGTTPIEYMGRGKWRREKSKMEDISSHGDRPIEEEEVQSYSFEDENPPEEES